jgi:peptidoglycan/xylan/chitin deacetylase (PgdA/CDA1 family)
LAAWGGLSQPSAAARTCTNPDPAGVSRVIEIDAAKGEIYGSIARRPGIDLLADREVVLTFDDGPYPGLTRQILDALDAQCTKATFFVVGRMAVAHPDILRETLARGHTVGTHTWSHPLHIRQQGFASAKLEIDRGISEAERAAGRPLSPFFRFPGLGDSADTVDYLRSRGIATFTVDIVSNDSFISSPLRVAQRTLSLLEQRGRGIVLFHDIKASTAQALPYMLDELKKRQFRIVHLVAKGQMRPPGPGEIPIAAPRQRTSPPGGPAEVLPWQARQIPAQAAPPASTPRAAPAAAPKATPPVPVPAEPPRPAPPGPDPRSVFDSMDKVEAPAGGAGGAMPDGTPGLLASITAGEAKSWPRSPSLAPPPMTPWLLRSTLDPFLTDDELASALASVPADKTGR